MKTVYAKLNPANLDVDEAQAILRQAADMLRTGGLVAFPTETVYGLGADAFNPLAVSKIYAVKGRPADNPLIVHVCDAEAAASLADTFPACAQALAAAFWPGPLTMVLPKKKALFGNGGHDTLPTVAVRVPSHPVARALIALSGCAIAAPSANLSGKPSPTRAAHVAEDLDGRVDMLIDGGDADGGLESTVVDVSGGFGVRILRPGVVTPEMIAAVMAADAAVDAVVGCAADSASDTAEAKPRAPGMKYRHYAPDASMTVVTGAPDIIAARFRTHITRHTGMSGTVGLLATAQTARLLSESGGWRLTAADAGMEAWRADVGGVAVVMLVVGDRDRPASVGRHIFAALRWFNALNVTAIYAEGIDETGVGLAVMNRLYKAASDA